MGSSTSDITMDEVAINSGTAIEIKIKTMDSQTYTMRVDKQTSVPALKEQIASVTGVVTEQQRLICRGKVLKDDQLLSAYHVEDGHTLHLVVRDPASASAVNLPNDPAIGSSSNSQGQYFQVAPGIIIETLSVPGQGDGSISNIGRIVSALMGSFGIGGPSTSGEVTGLGVIPDAVTTMSEYLSHMRHEFIASVRGNENNAGTAATHGAVERESNSVLSAESTQQGLPTPSSLAQLLLSTRQMLNQQTGECLQQLATQLENQGTVVDPEARLITQSRSLRTGILLQNLGAYLLELGRTTTTVRLGRAPSEAVVNAGPAVFISSSGPNPIMVQPLPFQPGASFGAPSQGNLQSGSSLVSGPGLGAAGVRRRIDIQIRRSPLADPLGSDGSQQQVGRSNPSTDANIYHADNQAAAATSGPLRGATVRVLPVRSMVATLPDLNGSPLDSSGNSSGSYYPLLGRYQHLTTQNLGGSRTGSQVSGENPPFVFQAEMQATPESAAQQGNMEDSTGNGQVPPSGSGQRDGVPTRTIDIDILSSRDLLNDQNAGGQIASGVLQLLRGLFQVENVSSPGMAGESSTDQGRPDSIAAQEEEPTVTEEGIFLSRLLHEIMPFISPDAQPNSISPAEESASESRDARESPFQAESLGAGTSRRESDAEPETPNPKRQKTE
ncbi:hypothetical protein Dimus_023445 [Dionaea muscipula]